MQRDNLKVSQTLTNREQNDNQFMFNSNNYIFPNSIQFSKQFKSCVTMLKISQKQLSQYQYKKLSIINKSRFIVQLKQIKKQHQQQYQYQSEPSLTSYKLYYQVIPFSLTYLKTSNTPIQLKTIKLQKILKDIVNDLIHINVYYQINIQCCGFNQYGQFKIFINPQRLINQKKVTSSQKIKMNTAYLSVVKYWQKQIPKIKSQNMIKKAENIGKGITYYQEGNIENVQNMKKTIKLPKSMDMSNEKNKNQNKSNHNKNQNIDNIIKLNMIKPKDKEKSINNDKKQNSQQSINPKYTLKNLKEPILTKIPKQSSLKNLQPPIMPAPSSKKSLKKYKSMQQILDQSNKDKDNINAAKIGYKSKINQINQKLNNIKSTLNTKKVTKAPKIEHNQIIKGKRQKKQHFNNVNDGNEDYVQDIIYQCKVNGQNIQHQQYRQRQYSQGQSFDTYLDQIGSQYKMPNFRSSNQLRKTAYPNQLLSSKNTSKPQQTSNNIWKHQSAGNSAFKAIIKKNKQLYPELMQQNSSIKNKNEPKNLTKSLKKQDQNKILKKILSLQSINNIQSKSSLKQGGKILKKITSLQSLDNRLQTMSIHLSQISKDLTNNRRKRDLQEKNIKLKEKVQDILIKSKKAIQLLKSPYKLKINKDN